MRKVTFFVPHYEDHQRLKTLLSLSNAHYHFPHNFIIYDSSPVPIGKSSIDTLLPNTEFTYREIKLDVKTNTYPFIVRDFMLSNDSNNGAFILPHDEFLLFDYSEFNSLPPSIPFSCGKQLSFCPDSKKIAEFCNSPTSQFAISYDHEIGLFNPQYHATYFPGSILKAIGRLFDFIINQWGSTEISFPGFVQFDLLRRLNIYYSNNSVYFQEKRLTRKSKGSFTHPSNFIAKKSKDEIEILHSYLVNFWKSLDTLSNQHESKSISFLLDSKKLSLSLLMTEMNSSKYLFELKSLKNGLINVSRNDIFCGYHQLDDSISCAQIKYIFGDCSTCLARKHVLHSLRYMINSYTDNDLDITRS